MKIRKLYLNVSNEHFQDGWKFDGQKLNIIFLNKSFILISIFFLIISCFFNMSSYLLYLNSYTNPFHSIQPSNHSSSSSIFISFCARRDEKIWRNEILWRSWRCGDWEYSFNNKNHDLIIDHWLTNKRFLLSFHSFYMYYIPTQAEV